MNYEESVVAVLDRYKRKNTEEYLILLPILNDNGNTIGFLQPVTMDFQVTMPECAERFGKWRIENPSFSPSRFEITADSTARWLFREILQNSKRILFLIQGCGAGMIGHIGIANIRCDSRTGEIDCVLRGEKEKIPGLMHCAMKTLVCWGKRELGLENFDLRVSWDNVHAIAFYQKYGFQKDGLIPLIRVETDGKLLWKPCETSVQEAEKYYLHMILRENKE